MRKNNRKQNNPFVIQSGKHSFIAPEKKYTFDFKEDISVDVIGKSKLGRNFNLKKLTLVRLTFLFFFLVLIFRVYWLQVVKGAYYRDLSDNNRIRISRIEAKRGIIYDAEHHPLVRNVANWLLYFIPADLPSKPEELEKIIALVSKSLGNMTSPEIKEKLAKIKKYSFESYQPLFIADNLNYQQAMLIYLKADKLPGVFLANKNRRRYNFGYSSLAHILGYTGKISKQEMDSGVDYSPIDYVGKTGLESFWESELRGTDGKKQIEVNALGQEKRIINQSKVVDGHNLVLSLDKKVQDKLEEVLSDYLKQRNLQKAVGIVLNPNNGEIIAMVSLPSFNDNLFAQGINNTDYQKLISDPNQPLFNRIVSGEYPSGSTIKPIVLSGALEEGVVNEYTSFLSTGGIRIGKWFFPDWKPGGHGLTNARKAIAESVNTYFYYIGGGFKDFVGLGIDRMVKYFKLFGLGSQTGIDLPGEADGFLPSREWKERVKHEHWYVGDTYHTAIGQGDLLVTPLQVAYYTTFFANNGTLYRPHLVKEILNGNDELISKIDTTPVRTNFIKPYNIKVVREGMRQTVLSGSARGLQNLPVSAAGKTGTAQWSSKHDPHAWFTGFAPYDNPEIVITILVEEGGGHNHTAVGVAQKFLAWYFGDYKSENRN